jgi:hypothetical protein
MAAPFTGGCDCGANRSECAAEPVMSGNCHWRDCQLNGSQPDMTTIKCDHDFFECPLLYHFTFS